ncbi:MAG: flavin reductase family protein [Candidatus Woesearchaeota archaeon]
MRFNEIANPRQAVLVTCKDEDSRDSKDNIIAVTWHSPVSFEPPLYMISIGKTRHSKEIISKSGCFTINFMSYELKDKVFFCGTHSGAHVDKFRECGFTKDNAQTIDCPKIKEASAHIECEVVNQIDSGDHIIFIGKVNVFNQNKESERTIHLGKDKFTTTRTDLA